MKILFIAQNAPPLHSGRARQALNLRRELLERGHTVDVWSVDTTRASADETGIISRRFQQENTYSNSARALYRVLTGGYDAVHFHGHHYLVALAPLLRRAGIRAVLNMSEIGFD